MDQRKNMTDTELDGNFDAFRAALPSLLDQHRGRFVIVRDRAVLDAYDTLRDAHLAGWRQFGDDRFSVQEVTDQPAYLGLVSHVIGRRTS